MSYALYAPHVAPFGAAPSPAVAAGTQILRSQPCYSDELDKCINASAPTGFPQCAEIRAAFAADVNTMNDVANQVPNCPLHPPVSHYIAAAAFGMAAGLVIGALL